MPTTIGALANVPNPGSPIASPWAQDVTRFARHQFTNAAALLAQWPTAPNGSHAVLLDTFAHVERRAGAWVYADPLVVNHTEVITAAAAKNFTLPFGVTYTTAPTAVQGTILVGANFDFVLNWQGAPTTTGVPARVFRPAGSNVTGNVGIHTVIYGGARPVV